MPGPVTKEKRAEKRASLMNLVVTFREEGKGVVGLDMLKSRLKVGDDLLKKLLDELQIEMPKLFVWLSESSIDVSPQNYSAERMNRNVKLKNAMADIVCSEIPLGATVAGSSGTSITTCIRAIARARRQLFVTTNNVGILEHCASHASIVVSFLGGEYSPESHSCIGREAVERLRETCCRIVLVSVSGVNDLGDLFVFHPEESPIHSVLATMPASKLIVLADATKLSGPDRWGFASLPELHKLRPLREIVLVTNSPSTPIPAA